MTLLEEYATGPAVLTVALIEAVAVSWFYGKSSLPGRILSPLPSVCRERALISSEEDRKGQLARCELLSVNQSQQRAFQSSPSSPAQHCTSFHSLEGEHGYYPDFLF